VHGVAGPRHLAACGCRRRGWSGGRLVGEAAGPRVGRWLGGPYGLHRSTTPMAWCHVGAPLLLFPVGPAGGTDRPRRERERGRSLAPFGCCQWPRGFLSFFFAFFCFSSFFLFAISRRRRPKKPKRQGLPRLPCPPYRHVDTPMTHEYATVLCCAVLCVGQIPLIL
jgi:hypothetical protein